MITRYMAQELDPSFEICHAQVTAHLITSVSEEVGSSLKGDLS